MHGPPEPDMEPPDEVQSLTCPECSEMNVDQGCGEYRCENPFCDESGKDAKEEWEDACVKRDRYQGERDMALRMAKKLHDAVINDELVMSVLGDELLNRMDRTNMYLLDLEKRGKMPDPDPGKRI